MRKLLNKFMVGCDPEFAILKGDELVTYRPLPAPLEGIGAIGEDHGGRVLELHPIQTRGVYALVKRMHALFPTLKQWETNGVRFKAGGIAKSNVHEDGLGGHVHFGFKRDIFYDPTPSGGRNAARLTKFATQLDKLTLSLEELDLLPSLECTRRRKTIGYGEPSDIRDSGQDNHIEYRTMASWLTSPELAFVCLTGAKLIAFNPDGDVPNPSSISRPKLRAFFEQYKEDTNAVRCLEKILDKLPKTDPTLDIREAWRKPLAF